MIESAFAIIGVIKTFMLLVGFVKFVAGGEKLLKKLADRPASDREATIYDHVYSDHEESLKTCQVSACAGLA